MGVYYYFERETHTGYERAKVLPNLPAELNFYAKFDSVVEDKLAYIRSVISANNWSPASVVHVLPDQNGSPIYIYDNGVLYISLYNEYTDDYNPPVPI
jgi:hypothetical protein